MGTGQGKGDAGERKEEEPKVNHPRFQNIKIIPTKDEK
jgi:hypothetical protein